MNPVKVSNYASVCIQTMQFLLRGMTRACCSESCPANIPLVFILHKLQCVSKPCATNALSHIFLVNFLQLMMSLGKDYLFPLQILNRLAF